MSLENMMIVAAALFAIGLYGALARRNVLVVLMSIELMFNAVNLTLVAMAKYVAPAGLAEDVVQNIGGVLTGQVFGGVHHRRSGGGNRPGSGDSFRYVSQQRRH